MSSMKSKASAEQRCEQRTAVFECGSRGETFKKMQSFFKNRKFCDVVLVAAKDNTRVSAHRIVLSAASEYFLEVLETSTTREITLEGVDGEMLNILVNFIYTATLEINGDNVDNIMRTASLLKLEAVITECCDYLAGRLSNTNCLPVAVFSKQRNYPDLCEKAFMYSCEHFTELFEEQAFLQLDIETLCKLLRRNDVCVTSEEDVFHGIMFWIQYDREKREKYTFQLLSQLRFPLLKPEFIANEIEEACQSPESQGLIIKAFKWHMSAASRSLFPPEICIPRNERREILLIKGAKDNQNPIVAELFDPLVGSWTCEEWPVKEQQGFYSNGIAAEGKVYLAGITIQGKTKISCVDSFDCILKKWTSLPAMRSYRHSFGMTWFDGQLYAVGGKNGVDAVCTVEKWDPNSPHVWEELAPMSEARTHPGLAGYNGTLYAIGSTRDFKNNTFESYDPKSNVWAELTPPSVPRFAVRLISIKGFLYAVGGRTSDGIGNMIERYDPRSNSWTVIPSLAKFDIHQQCVSSLDRIISLVKTREGRAVHVLEEFNSDTHQWRTLNPLERFNRDVMLMTK